MIRLTFLCLVVIVLSAAPLVRAQDSVQAVNAEFEKQVLELERQKLKKLEALAARQKPDEAQETYRAYFRSAISARLYAEAEPLAEKLLKARGTSPEVVYLCDVAALFAKVDRGDYEASFQTLSNAIHQAQNAGQAGEAAAEALPRSARIALIESYYQKLVQAGQYEVASKAFALILDASRDPVVKTLASNRLDRLKRVGRPAPEIAGPDIDGEPVSLQKLKGDVVLVVFWATWAIPSATEVGRLEEIYNDHKAEGFRVLGVNVDPLQAGGPDADATRSLVRRFLLDYNVPWPTLITGKGDADYAGHYGVTEVPSNFLVGKDGTIVAVDLIGSSLEEAVEKALKP